MVERVVELGRRDGVPLGQALIDAGIVNSAQLAQALAERNGLDYVDLNVFDVDKGAAAMIDGAKARRYRTIPIAFLAEQTLLVATADPANLLALDDITMATGYEVRRAVASPENIDALIEPAEHARGLRARDRGGEPRGRGDRAARVGRRGADREARPRRDRRRRAQGRVRHPLRAERPRHARALPRRRRRLRLHDRAAPPDLGPGLADQDHGRARHRREAHAPGRPHRAVGRRRTTSTCASRRCRPSAARPS